MTFLFADPCIEEERTVSGKMLKRLRGIDKASNCRKGCIQTDGCTVYLIRVASQECVLYSASVRVRNERAKGLILGRLNCELDKEETGLLFFNESQFKKS